VTQVPADTDADAELVLPFVIRIERADPPARTDALEAAAEAVLHMLTTERPEWQQALRAWDGQRIRKVVRRARGVNWERAQAIDGVSVTVRSATVRVYPPIPVDGWPADLARLQVGGTELDDPRPPEAPPAERSLVLLSPFVAMTTGKAMAQAAHAAQLGWRSASPTAQARWRADGLAVAVRAAGPAQWARAVAAGAPVVRDGGFTEVAPGSMTALAIVP